MRGEILLRAHGAISPSRADITLKSVSLYFNLGSRLIKFLFSQLLSTYQGLNYALIDFFG